MNNPNFLIFSRVESLSSDSSLKLQDVSETTKETGEQGQIRDEGLGLGYVKVLH